MIKNKKCRIVILVLFILILLFIGYKLIQQYKKEKRYDEWASSDIGQAILYAIEGTSYRTAGGKIAPASGRLVYALDGRGDCVKVINRMNEYLNLHPEKEILVNRKIEISFFSDWVPNPLYFRFSNYFDESNEIHKDIDVAYITDQTLLNGYINGDCVLVPRGETNDISYLVFDDIYFEDNMSFVEESITLFPNVQKVFIGYSKESDAYIKLSEEILKYLPDCDIESMAH